jgi:hypothetical protein
VDSSGKAHVSEHQAGYDEIQAHLDKIKKRLHFLDGYDADQLELLKQEVISVRDLLA